MIRPYHDRVRYFRARPDDEFLLKALLLTGQEELEAWKTWRRLVDIEDHATHATVTLLPFVYRKFAGRIKDPLIEIARGVYRRTWYLNNTLFQEAAQLLQILEQAGIPTMVLKGAALALTVYQDVGLRRMDDVDILVPFTSKLSAIKLLEQHGWKLNPSAEQSLPRLFLKKHGEEFRNARNKAIDLHWNIFYASRQRELDELCWQRAESLQLLGSTTKKLSATDQLLHVCVHGLSYQPRDQVRWILDAAELIRRAQIDWDMLIAQATERRIMLQLKDALRYLSEVFKVPVPKAALELLSKLPETEKDYILYSHYTFQHLPQDFEAAAGITGRLPRGLDKLWRRHMISQWTFERDATLADQNQVQKLLGFANYLRVQMLGR